MFAASTFANQKIAVFGLARSGLALIDALVAGGAAVLAWDDNEASVANCRENGLPITDLREVDFATLDALVLSPGVPLTHPEPHWTVRKAKAAGVEIIGDTEVFMRQIASSDASHGARTVCITGTNGKSTTTALIGHILDAAGYDAHVGGNIGKAVFLLPPPGKNTIYVLELSSYQIDLMPTLKPDVGILMNLTSDHLDRHGTMSNYAGVKARMFARQSAGDTAVISIDDAWCREIFAQVKAPVRVAMSVERVLSDGVSASGGILRDDGEEIADLRGLINLRGRHNWQNACAAYAAARAIGACWETIVAGLRSFSGLAHRMEVIGRRDNVIFINDSKATNADAAGHALSAFKRIYWIAGGRAKSGGIEQLAPLFGHVAGAYLIGEAARDFAATLGDAVPVSMCDTLDKAVAKAAADAGRDDADEVVVLLSPACASFDQFANFEIRGDAYRAAVEALDGFREITGEAA